MQNAGLPAISVVLPIYNATAFVDQCVRSVLSQTYSDFELLVGDDASSDSSFEIVSAFSDPRIRLHRNESNCGLFGNLNRLLGLSRGQIIHILCQDDFLYPDCLEVENAFYDAHPRVGFAFTKTRRFNERSELLGECALSDLPSVMSPSESLQYFYYYGCLPGNLSTVSLRKALLVGPDDSFDERFGVSADYEMWVRLARRADLGVIHKHLIGLRQHADQLSRSPRAGLEAIRANRAIRSILLPLLPAAIRRHACRYGVVRHNVLDFHFALHCLLSGRFRATVSVFQGWGFLESAASALAWAITADNRLYRPQPRFLTPST